MLTPNITLQNCIFLADEVTSVDLRSDGGARATAGGRIRTPLPPPTNPSSSPPGCWLPRFLLLVSGNPRTVLAVVGPERDQPSGEVSREERLPAGGRGDDHASQARGAAAGPPDPVGPVLLRRARRLLAQPPHRLQVSLPPTCSRPISNSVRLTDNVTRRK